jgi:hypothetical protein
MIAGQFRTTLSPKKATFNIGFTDQLMLVGSCFSVEIGKKLEARKFSLCANPNGIVYHPLAISQLFTRLLEGKPYATSDLSFANEKWFSFLHHGDFDHPDQQRCLDQINNNFEKAHAAVEKLDVLFLTFGTAFVYRLQSTGQPVANCHKLPATEFRKELSSIEDIVAAYRRLIEQLKKIRPQLQVVLSISPVRHLRDGLEEDRLSKSILRVAIEMLTREYKNCSYFPAYELLQDDLRDYRFYDRDMVHPSEQAVDYIWNHFLDTYVSASDQAIVNEIEQLNKALNHRPLHPETKSHAEFLKSTEKKKEVLARKYPFLNWV